MRVWTSLLVLLVASIGSAQLLFTEYVEGSGHNKALEVTNASEAPFDLLGQQCQIEMYFNGQESPEQSFNLNGELMPGDSLVFFHRDNNGNYAPDFLEAANDATNAQHAGFGWFNGNDAVVLSCAGHVVDSLGQVSDDAYWGRDLTLRRAMGPPRRTPSMAWSMNELGWQRFGKNTFDGLGYR